MYLHGYNLQSPTKYFFSTGQNVRNPAAKRHEMLSCEAAQGPGVLLGFMADKPPVVLTIAGFDPSSGAGVTADIKTIAAHGCYGVACIAAMTVQSTSGVRRVESVDPSLITDTLEELVED